MLRVSPFNVWFPMLYVSPFGVVPNVTCFMFTVELVMSFGYAIPKNMGFHTQLFYTHACYMLHVSPFSRVFLEFLLQSQLFIPTKKSKNTREKGET